MEWFWARMTSINLMECKIKAFSKATTKFCVMALERVYIGNLHFCILWLFRSFFFSILYFFCFLFSILYIVSSNYSLVIADFSLYSIFFCFLFSILYILSSKYPFMLAHFSLIFLLFPPLFSNGKTQSRPT